MEEERRSSAVQQSGESTGNGRNKPEIAKPFCIHKQEVMAAWKHVRNNGGAEGIDEMTLEDFGKDLKRNLYTVWNRLSSGSYFPDPVRRVEIPKGGGKLRPLGIPTVRDRIAQQVVRARLEPVVEPLFHKDSYGFRPKRSTIDAVGVCRERCFKYGWVVDVDIEKFFDTLNHELLMKAVKKHCREKWMVLYIERWLKAGVMIEGEVYDTETGTPQGGVISPLLANLYLHYAFDLWMQREYPHNPFERYADDMVIHCKSEREAQAVREALDKRMTEVGLKLHPEKTRIVFCPTSRRTQKYENVSFTFLGYTFKPRSAQSKSGERFTSFLPAVSTKAKSKFRANLKKRKLFRNTTLSLDELAGKLNPIVRGWLAHKRKISRRQAIWIFKKIYALRPKFFAHWTFFEFQG